MPDFVDFIRNASEKELLKFYEKSVLNNARKSGLLKNSPELKGGQSITRHDLWSVYDYGDIVKIVYIKSAPKPLKNKSKRPKFEKNENSENERFSNSISRSKSRIFELAMCNEFNFFCTFTQDQKLRDRFDLKEFRKDFAQLVRNINRSRGENEKIKYLLIPEQHKNGAWHMHGLLAGLKETDLRKFTLAEKLPNRIRKQIEKGVEIYDWTRYRKAFGYFTCTKIEDKTACSKYITKYISKDLQKTVRDSGEHLFFASQGLKGREAVVKNCFDKCPVTEWDFENEFIKIKEINVRKMGQ